MNRGRPKHDDVLTPREWVRDGERMPSNPTRLYGRYIDTQYDSVGAQYGLRDESPRLQVDSQTALIVTGRLDVKIVPLRIEAIN
jgi:hypothetical protein